MDSSVKLIPYVWTSVTITYVMGGSAANQGTNIFIFNYNLLRSAINYGNAATISGFATSDVVRLGGPTGFIGSIGNFKIFNPGSSYLNIRTKFIIYSL